MVGTALTDIFALEAMGDAVGDIGAVTLTGDDVLEPPEIMKPTVKKRVLYVVILQ